MTIEFKKQTIINVVLIFVFFIIGFVAGWFPGKRSAYADVNEKTKTIAHAHAVQGYILALQQLIDNNGDLPVTGKFKKTVDSTARHYEKTNKLTDSLNIFIYGK